jgi:bifunctional non-homologous end joining protein LigD
VAFRREDASQSRRSCNFLPIYFKTMRALSDYQKKRDFRATKEPKGGRPAADRAPIFVVQRHAARRLHFDFRLQVGGTLASWAVPKGPPEEIGEKRLAIHVEDHPLEYAKFEGDIPAGNYGAGHVDIWDQGTFRVEGPLSAAEQIEKGEIKFRLLGKRLNGTFVLVKMQRASRGNEWLFIRKIGSDSAAEPEPQKRGRETATNGADNSVLDAKNLDGAKKSAMPANISVALAQLSDKVFANSEWLFEIKWDGERAVAFIQDGEVEFRSRSGRNITPEYPELKSVVKQLSARRAIVDGEIVALDDEGRSDFTKIQPRFGVSNPPISLQQKNPVTYYLFDLLYCDGFDLRNCELEKRKGLLQKLLRPSDKIRYSDHVVEKGTELFEIARERRLEGIIAKRRDSPYIGKRTSSWLKFKIVHDLDVVIGGWTEPRKSRDHFGALLMGMYFGKALKYIGSVGTGFNRAMLERTRKTLDRLAIAESPFDMTPQLRELAHWVKPELVARVKFGQWTKDKKLRQPVFLGFQEDHSASDCRVEAEVPPSEKSSAKDANVQRARVNKAPAVSSRLTTASAGVTAEQLQEELSEGSGETLNVELEGKRLSLTHLNKVYFKRPSLRKRDVLLYYLRIAPNILPFLKDRPMVLKRYPNGIDGEFFFQKEAPKSRPEWVQTVDIFSKERGAQIPYVLANDLAALLYLANLGCIDHNPWSSRFDDEEHPDYLFFDLDPTERATFADVLRIARGIHEQLQALKINSFLKTSGASGFHIYVPIERKYTYEEVRLFAGGIGQRVQAELPEIVTFERTVSKRREGTVLVDAVQNAKGKPLAAPYSLRPFDGAPVSTPVTATEIKRKVQPEGLNISTIFKRLSRQGDLWKKFWASAQTLEGAVDRAT